MLVELRRFQLAIEITVASSVFFAPWFRIISAIGKRGSVGRVGPLPDQEKGADELLPTERERTIPDLQPKKSQILLSKFPACLSKMKICIWP
ncbi:hypothetical protein BTJ40_06920 [Microbulbifer sp. A4B17]|nr:hypothetical protein BTJ40_06920 [Microbulbifer sp. A4B17]